MLLDLLQLRLSVKELTVEALPLWGIFSVPEAFSELFCVAFRLFHSTCVRGHCRAEDLDNVLAEVVNRVFEHLAKKPATYDAFINMAMVAGDLDF